MGEHYGVYPRRVHWLAQVPEVFPNHGRASPIGDLPAEPAMVDRFLAGGTDALITDISDAAPLSPHRQAAQSGEPNHDRA